MLGAGHGNCSGFEVCSCDEGWEGNSCDSPSCSQVNECSLQGQCVSPNTCYCYAGYEGSTCSETSSPNLHAPVFGEADDVIKVKIRETDGAGRMLLTVNATDEDSGSNGEVRYSLDPSDAQIDVTNYVIIDSTGGQLVLTNPISRAVLPSGLFAFKVVASDQGVPSLTSELTVNVSVTDVNDNCPVVTQPPSSGVTIYVNKSITSDADIFTFAATDADFVLAEKCTKRDQGHRGTVSKHRF